MNGYSDKAGGGVVHPPLPKLKKNTSEQTIPDSKHPNLSRIGSPPVLLTANSPGKEVALKGVKSRGILQCYFGDNSMEQTSFCKV